MEKIKIVILESPYDTWSNPQVGEMFKELVGLKLRGYGHEYPYGVMPVDGNDLISTHIALCREDEQNKLVPIMAMRWTSLKKTRLHYGSFPGMNLLQQAGSKEHVQALEKIISDLDERGEDLIYTASLTIEPSERTSKERSVFFREILTMMFVCQQRELGFPELMAGGTCRFKIEKWLEATGWEALKNQQQPLAPIHVKHLAGEDVQVMHLREFSFEGLRVARKWQSLWDNRLIIGKPDASSGGEFDQIRRSA